MNILKESHHRNGISGAPFKIGIIQDDPESDFIANSNGSIQVDKGSKKLIIQFEDKAHCAVLDLELLKKGIIEFGQNSWRGDQYNDVLKFEDDLN